MMKRVNIITAFLGVIFLLGSCSNFLELQPRETRIVSTIEDYRDILASYVRMLKTPNWKQEVVFGISDFTFPPFNVAENLGIYTGETNLARNTFYWDKEKGDFTVSGKNLMTWLSTDIHIWNQYYSFLGPINQIIREIASAKGTDEDLRNYVKGEALVWRAFAYFKLLQYYSPYKNNECGIPVYLDPVNDIIGAMPERKTQKEVFAQILGDCQEVIGLLKKTPTNEWNCAYRSDFLHAMMASIYTWKAMSGAAEDSDWSNAETCATEAMKERVLTNSPEVLRQIFDCRKVTNETFMQSDEFYFRIISSSEARHVFTFYTAYYEGSLVDGGVNRVYYDMFAENDIRKICYFNSDGSKSDKYNMMGLGGLSLLLGGGGGSLVLFRLAEMYLIKAEALFRQGKMAEAKGILEEFKRARYTGDFSFPDDENGLLREILNERIREFYMENDFRWLDMKRLGTKMERVIAGEKFMLTPDDFRYSFPIPKKELELNRNLTQTPGWENIILE